MGLTDTIAAVATAQGEGGVGIIRISGPDALRVALVLFRTTDTEIQDRRLHYGSVIDRAGNTVDIGFLAYMKAPRSYTGEDVVELHCHGGPLILKEVLEVVIGSGARLARPGEFTKRAFLNGKLDLAQAEAVIDLIRAQTELSLSAARGRLEGDLSRKVNAVKGGLFNLLARLEAELDFSEHEIDELPAGEILSGMKEAEGDIEKLLSTYGEGRAIREGVKTLILGRPNAGKSSLLNILLQEERAIVTPVPGTTRDIIEEVVSIRGIPVRLMDTAGLRHTDDQVEAIGVRLAKDRIKDAALILYLIDASTQPFSEDREYLFSMEGREILIVANKSDLLSPEKRAGIESEFEGHKMIFISALTGDGVEGLKEEIFTVAAGRRPGLTDVPPGELVASLRHKESLEKSLEGLRRAQTAMEDGLAKEFVATDLRAALDSLGEITGETTTEDILERIFSSFCIGK